MSRKHLVFAAAALISLIGVALMSNVAGAWPSDSDWIYIDWDKNENGLQDDWRDVEEAYYYYDEDYLYLRLKCYGVPGSEWKVDTKVSDARYKWFINTTMPLYMSGGNIIGASYLLFVEDTDDDGIGEIYLLEDIEGDGKFDEYGPGQQYDYRNYTVTDPKIADFRISGNYIDMMVNWTSLDNPRSYGLMWATDQENPNLNQAPTTDHPDEERGIVVHDVVAVSQQANATEVEQGETVKVSVEVRNSGTCSESFDVTVYFGPKVTCAKRVENLAAGATTLVEFDCPTAGVEPGTYIIRAFADSAGEIAEINEENNWCTAQATVTVKVHDVAAISQTTNVTTVEQGGWVRIDVVVKNFGNYTETFNVTVYYDNTPIDTKTVNSLDPGSETTVSFDWNTAGVSPETYFIKAFADSSRSISEFNEENNNCTATTIVTVAPAQAPSISVEKALVRVVDGPDPAIVGYSTTYEIEILVVNTGNVELVNINVTDYIYEGVTYISLGTPSNGTAQYRTVDGRPVIVWNITSLNSSESATLTFSVTLTPNEPGIFILNRGQDLTAVGRTEGYATVSDTADLDVTVYAYTRDVEAISQTPAKDTVIQGETVGIDVVVKNSGNYSAETFNVTLFYSPDQTTWMKIEPIHTIRVYSLGENEETTIRFAWDTSGVPPGTYYIRAMADSSRELLETYEENNNCTAATTIKVQVHDIVAVSQSTDVTSVIRGGIVKITAVIRNDGSETETFTVRCYYGTPTISPIQIGSDQTMTLESGKEATLEFIWDTSGVDPGTYWIEVRALPVNGEIDTNDNTCTTETPVTVVEKIPVGGEIIVSSSFNAPETTIITEPIIVIILAATILASTKLLLKTKRH